MQGLCVGRAYLEAVRCWRLAPQRLHRLPIIEHAFDTLDTLHALGGVLNLWHILSCRQATLTDCVTACELPAAHIRGHHFHVATSLVVLRIVVAVVEG